MLTPAQLAAQVRRIEITTRHAVTEVFAGEYSSAFKGRGIEFADVREYQPGDDARTIDWNVTARTGKPFIKRFIEERELTVILAVDMSASGAFGSGNRDKRSVAAEVCATLAFAAMRKGDRVGLLAFTDRVEWYLPPRKGPRHVLRLVRDLLAFEPRGAGTSIRAATDHLAHVLKRRAVVFFVSDFLTNDFAQPLRLLSGRRGSGGGAGGARHDMVAIDVSDPRENELPRIGWLAGGGVVEMQDAETGKRAVIDLGSRRVRAQFKAQGAERRAALASSLRRAGVDHLSVSVGRPYLHDLMSFFHARELRR